jgi:serine/threonine protein kinase
MKSARIGASEGETMSYKGKPLNGELIRELMRCESLTRQALQDRMSGKEQVSHQTLGRALRGIPVSERSGIAIAKTLDVAYVDILHPDEQARRPPGVDSQSPGDGELFREWQTDGIPSSWVTASNGLQYKVVKMRHREVTERVGRGKIFDLKSLGDDARQGMRHALARHGTVCQRVRGKPGVPTNLTVRSSRDLTKWLIVDEWIEGDTLDLRIERKTLEGIDTRKLLTRIAQTLSHLHKAEVLRRELSPRFIILRADDFPILTDFELGKLFAGSRTVSNGAWQEDPYRAPEVETGEIRPDDYRADLYSWGRIAVRLLAGRLPAAGKDGLAMQEVKVPKEVGQMVLACTDQMEAVLKVLKAWK